MMRVRSILSAAGFPLFFLTVFSFNNARDTFTRLVFRLSRPSLRHAPGAPRSGHVPPRGAISKSAVRSPRGSHHDTSDRPPRPPPDLAAPMFAVTSASSLAARPRVASARALGRGPARVAARRGARSALSVRAEGTKIQFVKGTDETSVPDVRLTRSKDGSNGTAFFLFSEPDVFEATELTGEITGMYLIDQEGELQTVDVNAKFLNGKPQGIEATYVMKTTAEWNRFMRFMERYAEDNGLGFSKK